MGEGRWFCRNDDEWNALAERLKLMPCPRCRVVGALIRHGNLRGHDEGSPRLKAVRARRIFCSNRGKRLGCGRTISIWVATKIRRLGLTTGALWRFLQRVVAGSVAAAVRATPSHLSDRTLQRIWRRFDQGQSKIRTALLEHCAPPTLIEPSRRPAAAQALAHLQAAFPDVVCPIAAFQHAFHTFFV